MSARLLLNIVHSMLLEAHGEEKVAEMLAPPDPAFEREQRRAQLAALGVEVA